MKALLTLLCLLPIPALADDPIIVHGGLENVALKGSISFLRCEPPASGNGMSMCKRTPTTDMPFTVNLTNESGGAGITGETVLKATQDGAAFETTLAVTKVLVNGDFVYKVEAYLSENVGTDNTTFDFVGLSLVKHDIARFNDTVWSGKPTIAGAITLTPFISLSR